LRDNTLCANLSTFQTDPGNPFSVTTGATDSLAGAKPRHDAPGMPGSPTRLEHGLGLSLGLVPALAFLHPTGYSVGPVLLLLGSIAFWVRHRHAHRFWADLPTSVKLIIIALATYALVWMTDGLIRGEGVRDTDRPSRFLFAAFCLLVIAHARIHAAWLWAGIAFGGISTGALAIGQKLIDGASRATGMTQTVQYGNLSMAVGLTCLAGLPWALAREPRDARVIWTAAMVIGGMGGVLAGFLSGTRGSWLALIAVLPVALWTAVQLRQVRRFLLGLPVVLTLAIGGLYLTPETSVKARFDTAVDQIHDYFVEDKKTGSVPYRLEMWKGAWVIFTESPLIGHGEIATLERLKALGDEGVIVKRASRFTHMHNDWFDVLAERGILGFIVLLGVYTLPIAWFARYPRRSLASDVPTDRSTITAAMRERIGLASAGITFPVALIASGMSQVNFAHNSGAMMYAFMIAGLVGVSVVLGDEPTRRAHA